MTDNTAIRPFHFEAPQADLVDLRNRVKATKWPEREQVTDASQGVQERDETGKAVRLDSTVTAALMHEPSDSSLLWDAVRVMGRLLSAADGLIGGRLVWRNHRRAAKKRARAIEYARDRLKRVQHYRELIKLTRATLAYADQAAAQIWQAPKQTSSLRLIALLPLSRVAEANRPP